MKQTLLAIALAVVTGQGSACGVLTASDAWARLAPPTASVMAGYVTFANASEQSVALTSARSKDFDRVELHSMTMDNGVMQMRKLDSVEVKAGAELALAPGGMHLMLIGPKRAFLAGESIDVVVRLCDETEQTVALMVREPAPE